MNISDISSTLHEGIKHIASEQQKDGSFLHYSSKNPNQFKSAFIYHSTFPTSLILLALVGAAPSFLLQNTKKRAAHFLLSQKNKNWSFNYWKKNSNEAKTMPYPDDLDDTFCALSALYTYNSSLIDGNVWAYVTKILTHNEDKEGGPYRTWIVSKNTTDRRWHDVDLAVNSNVAYFLHLHDIYLPGLISFIEKRVKTNSIFSPYYPSLFPIVYFISRLFRNNKQASGSLKKNSARKLQEILFSKRRKDGSWENPLYTSLAITSLLNLDNQPKELDQSITYLLSHNKNGCWYPYALYMDPQIDVHAYYAGSSALTTAFCFEAIENYAQRKKSVEKYNKRQPIYPNTAEQTTIYYQVVQRVKDRFSTLDKELKDKAFSLLEEMIQKDKDKQIVLMPYFFKTSLGTRGKLLSHDLLIQLGVANILGWISYTIYDNFLDEEGDPTTLSVANIALRELTSLFDALLPKHSGFKTFFHAIMDQLDAANYWEVSHCRISIHKSALNLNHFTPPDFGSYQKLANKSLGHVLSPIAILFSLGYNKNSKAIKNILAVFTHYLTARQLNDDAHDWEKDLKMGHVNAVGALLLTSYQKRYTDQSTLRLSKLIPILQKLFWYEVVVEVCQTMITHVRLARKALAENSIIENSEIFKQLLLSIEQSAHHTLNEQKEMIKFLNAYHM